MPNKPAAFPKQDPIAFTFLVAMALAAAVVTGASLSGVASGAVQDMLRTAGFGQDSEIKAEQRRQALALAKIETSFGLVRGEVAILNARIADAEKPHLEAAKEATKEATKEAPAPGHVDTGIDLAALRTSLDEHAERNRNEFSAVNKRIDWLEKLVYSPDVTGSVAPPAPPAPGRRHGAQSVPEWFVLHAEKGVAVIAGKAGTIDVTPGFVVPDLGRVAAIRQQAGHWVVVMDKGVTIRER
jgi:hypothetical protein